MPRIRRTAALKQPTNQVDTSPLLRLPPELRNEIYELILYQQDGVVVDVQDGQPQVICDTDERVRMLTLTATCKKIRGETRLLFFSINRFRVRSRQLEARSKKRAIGSKPMS